MSNQFPGGWTSPPPAPPRKRHIGRWIGLSVLGLIVVIVVASLASGGGQDTSTGSATGATAKDNNVSRGLGSSDATADVKIDKGSLSSSYGIAKATLTITNHSAKRSDYYIEAVLLNSAGENIGTANTLVSAVEPGQVAHTELTGSYTGKLAKLKINQVQRTASV